MGNEKDSFGAFAKAARLKKGLGLRQVAREFGISAAYLSRVENDLEPPSGELIALMAPRYEVSAEDLTRRVGRPNTTAVAHGRILQTSPELRALYRLGTQLDATVVDDLIRRALKKQGTSEEEIEKALSFLKSELPRVASSARDGLFAAEAKPRFLTRRRISTMAYDLLTRYGPTEKSYVPPTPIEVLVETEPGVSYTITPLKCHKNGAPLVLGQTGWNAKGERQIAINSALADSHRACDEHRFNFTLGHELFHAIEHLPRVAIELGAPLARLQLCEAVFVNHGASRTRSAAERAVNSWANNRDEARGLCTDEDWREWQANSFASALLMPEWFVIPEFARRCGDKVIEVGLESNPKELVLHLAGRRMFESSVFGESLAELFAVSRQAMAIRLLELGLVKEDKAEKKAEGTAQSSPPATDQT